MHQSTMSSSLSNILTYIIRVLPRKIQRHQSYQYYWWFLVSYLFPNNCLQRIVWPLCLQYDTSFRSKSTTELSFVITLYLVICHVCQKYIQNNLLKVQNCKLELNVKYLYILNPECDCNVEHMLKRISSKFGDFNNRFFRKVFKSRLCLCRSTLVSCISSKFGDFNNRSFRKVFKARLCLCTCTMP